MDSAEKSKPSIKARLSGRMHDPLQLRAVLCVAVLAVWYSAGYTPMKDGMAASTAKLDRDGKRLALATEIEALREEVAEFADRLPPRSDPNEFLQYVLGGVRSGPLRLVSLSPEKPKDAGPYQVASVRIELEGKYKDVDAFLRWVENDRRMLRVDSLRAEPDAKGDDALRVQMSVLGLMGAEEPAKPAPKPEPKAKRDAAKAKLKARHRAAAPAPPSEGEGTTSATPPGRSPDGPSSP